MEENNWRMNKDIVPEPVEGKTWRWTKQGWRATCNKQVRKPKVEVQQDKPDQQIDYLKQILEALNNRGQEQKKQRIEVIEDREEVQKPVEKPVEVQNQKKKVMKPLKTENPFLKSMNIQVSDEE
ncbi:Hypothetical_protein [Hexamita inflata]|uniref:Hypothetical_protein n=1 Tax=Hexamita inflata TaxID=28002 RepID=A0ABP1H0P7_9EUKA